MTRTTPKKSEAVLLLGPTGSGKTPLGDYLAQQGLFGRRCVHFDFGAQLRLAGERGGAGLSQDDVVFIRKVLTEGALLEDDTFYLARTIMETFMTAQQVADDDLIILNGLPRHAGQARDVSTALNVILVAALECTAETVHMRIAGNSGGDRTHRTDDSVAEIERKLEIYADRTRPLLDYYRTSGVPCRLIPVGVDTTPAAIREYLNRLEEQQRT